MCFRQDSVRSKVPVNNIIKYRARHRQSRESLQPFFSTTPMLSSDCTSILPINIIFSTARKIYVRVKNISIKSFWLFTRLVKHTWTTAVVLRFHGQIILCIIHVVIFSADSDSGGARRGGLAFCPRLPPLISRSQFVTYRDLNFPDLEFLLRTSSLSGPNFLLPPFSFYL